MNEFFENPEHNLEQSSEDILVQEVLHQKFSELESAIDHVRRLPKEIVELKKLVMQREEECKHYAGIILNAGFSDVQLKDMNITLPSSVKPTAAKKRPAAKSSSTKSKDATYENKQ